MRRGRDTERRFDHATDHDEHVVRARGGDHPQRFAQRAAFGELDVDAVHPSRQARDVGGDETAFVHHDRELVLGRDAPHLEETLQIVRRKRLLEKLDAGFLQLRDHLLGALHVPTGVRVDPNRLVGRVADGPQDFLVAVRAELHFQDRIVLGLEDLGADFLIRIESNGERGEGRLFGIESPQPPEGLAQLLADQVV